MASMSAVRRSLRQVATIAARCGASAGLVAEAGASLADVVRVTYILPEPADFEPCWPVLRERLGDVRPAATMLSARLADDRIKIEIEATARRRRCRISGRRAGRKRRTRSARRRRGRGAVPSRRCRNCITGWR